MIIRLFRSKSDIENLSRLKTIIPTGIDRYDYKRCVVNKPWGYEYLMFENTEVAIWVLYLKEGHATSMHCHPNKKTSLVVLKGLVNCSTLEGFMSRKEGEGLIIETSVFHSTKAISKGGAMIMEVESPPNKRDLVRLKDAYGREGAQYEGADQMSRELSKYEYVDFHDTTSKKKKAVRFGLCEMNLHTHAKPLTVHARFQKERAKLVCLLSGQLHDEKGNVILRVGEAISSDSLRNVSRLRAFSAIMYLTISHHGKKTH